MADQADDSPKCAVGLAAGAEILETVKVAAVGSGGVLELGNTLSIGSESCALLRIAAGSHAPACAKWVAITCLGARTPGAAHASSTGRYTEALKRLGNVDVSLNLASAEDCTRETVLKAVLSSLIAERDTYSIEQLTEEYEKSLKVTRARRRLKSWPLEKVLKAVASKGTFNWAILEPTELRIHGAGSGGFEEMKEWFEPSKVMFGIIRVNLGGGISKHVFIHWIGPDASTVKKGQWNSKVGGAEERIRGFMSISHRITVHSAEDLNLTSMMDKLKLVTYSVEEFDASERKCVSKLAELHVEDVQDRSRTQSVASVGDESMKKNAEEEIDVEDAEEDVSEACLPNLSEAIIDVRKPDGQWNWVLVKVVDADAGMGATDAVESTCSPSTLDGEGSATQDANVSDTANSSTAHPGIHVESSTDAGFLNKHASHDVNASATPPGTTAESSKDANVGLGAVDVAASMDLPSGLGDIEKLQSAETHGLCRETVGDSEVEGDLKKDVRADDGAVDSSAEPSASVESSTDADAGSGHQPEAEASPLRPPAWMESAQSGDGSKLRVDGMDFYALLGVEQTADVGDFKRAYREQALLWHPDKAGPTATEHFQALGEAYEALVDAEKRQIYDQMLAYYPPPRPTAAELFPGGFQEMIEPFRASPSDLHSVATFLHAGRMWVPKHVGDISWQRPSRDPTRVRVTFVASYDPGPTLDGNSLEARGEVHDSMNLHLATLLLAGGWRAEDSEQPSHDLPADDSVGQQREGSEFELPLEKGKQEIVVARCCLLGTIDNSEFHLKSARINASLGSMGARFAVEGVPDNLKVLFAHSRAFASSGSWTPDSCVVM